MTSTPSRHSQAFLTRRVLNWFPLGLSYALLYMGRYNLTVAKTSLGVLMTKEDFGIIFGTGTLIYALAFLFNGPLVDRYGGRLGMLIAVAGSAVANLLMGLYLISVLNSPGAEEAPIRLVFCVLYGLNMYFQSFGAVSIVKVNAHWFHVRERGGFSGVFGTMIASGIFLAFTINGWLLDLAADWWPGQRTQWVVFLAPSALLGIFYFVELALLKDRPGDAGFKNFDTGDASSGEDDKPVPVIPLIKRILTHPVIITIAFVEFCTGVLRNGVMHWFPIYAKEVWALPGSHPLRYGSWDNWPLTVLCFGVAIVSVILATRSKVGGGRRGLLWTLGALAFLAPFMQGGWGGLLFVAGVIGGNVAGWVSDLFFQSRRAPAAAGLYGILVLCSLLMVFSLSPPTNVVKHAADDSGLRPGDRIVSIAGVKEVERWDQIANAVACYPPRCEGSRWDAKTCVCTTREVKSASAASAQAQGASGVIPAVVVREGERISVRVKDPAPVQRAGDRRSLSASPVLPLSPYLLGILIFVMSLSVIGTHGLLSGTATMDFGGRKGAATAVGVIDGFVYAGTALQSVVLGYLTTDNWFYWPIFLLPFGVIGFFLLLRIWHARPGSNPIPAGGRGKGKK